MSASRFLVMAQPPPAVLQACESELREKGLAALLKEAMFDPANWHQSLTAPSFEQTDVEPLWRACSHVRASACTVALNRIRGSGRHGSIHWSFHARGTPACFKRLLAEMKEAQVAERLSVPHGHQAHITISYSAPFALPTQPIRPIQWTIDEILLVEGHTVKGRFVYDVIDRWPLQPPEPPRQRDFFD
jgi:2'-5' RNA ligase